MKCRHCRSPIDLCFLDLGSSPAANAYLTADKLRCPEKWFPLRVMVCTRCWLVQTEDYIAADELFDSEYAYFSSTSSSWLMHAKTYVNAVSERFKLTAASNVVEVASNDGYLLQYFQERGINCLGIEPTANTAAAARKRGIDTREIFFGRNAGSVLREEGCHADLIVANNVLAHVPDINDFVAGFVPILKVHGVATFEFPHLLQMVAHNQFDTIYHEHFSYLSLTAVARIFDGNGLAIFDLEELPTHGGSLRVYAQRKDSGKREFTGAVSEMLSREEEVGIADAAYYAGFQQRVEQVKNDFLDFLLEAKRQGKKVAGYGAAAKGNTLINFAGIRPDLIGFVVDRAPSKQGKFLPGSRIPIVDEARIWSEKPDFVLILPWNLKHEITNQLADVKTWGGQFVTAIPSLAVV